MIGHATRKIGQITLIGLVFALLVTACIQPDITTGSTAPVADKLVALDDSWQSYENSEIGFTIRYPADWQLKTLPAENNGQIQGVMLTGAAGAVELRWGSGIGGACPGLQQSEVQVAQGMLSTCYVKHDNGIEYWEQINQELAVTGFSARAYTASATAINHEVILQVLATLRFQEGNVLANYDDLVEKLRAATATVEPESEISQPFFTVRGRLINLNGQAVQVFEYTSIADAQADISQVAPGGSSVGTSMISWMATPHFYHSGRVIVLYVGDDSAVLDLLSSVLGMQFAGG